MPVETALGHRIDLALWSRAELDLTDRQIDDLRALRADFEDRMVELRQEARQAPRQLREDLREDREALQGDHEARRERMQEVRRQMRESRQGMQEAQAPFLERYGGILNADQREWLVARTVRPARMGRRAAPRRCSARHLRPGCCGGGTAVPPAPETGR